MYIESFKVVGISVRTTNENLQSAKDIGRLWERFLKEEIAKEIPRVLDPNIYCVYSEYEGDFMAPYTVILGCKVENLGAPPKGMETITIPSGEYIQFTAKGNIVEGAVFKEWQNIWNSDLSRAYTVDFEVYGKKAQNPENAEVDIYVAVN